MKDYRIYRCKRYGEEIIAKDIAMAVRTTTALDAVLAVLAMPLRLWKMRRQS